MWNVQTILVWAFGFAMAILMLGSVMHQRRQGLTERLREHVRRKTGKPPVEQETDPDSELELDPEAEDADSPE